MLSNTDKQIAYVDSIPHSIKTKKLLRNERSPYQGFEFGNGGTRGPRRCGGDMQN